jgi:hypothetical protein
LVLGKEVWKEGGTVSALVFLRGNRWGLPVAKSLAVEVVRPSHEEDKQIRRQVDDRAAAVPSGRKEMLFAIGVSTFHLPSH